MVATAAFVPAILADASVEAPGIAASVVSATVAAFAAEIVHVAEALGPRCAPNPEHAQVFISTGRREKVRRNP